MENEHLVELRDIHKEFNAGTGKVHVLRGIDLSIPKKATIAVLGASGAGKTTLLHIIATLERPTSGHIMYKGSDITRDDEMALAAFRNSRIGLVFQLHHLLPEFSAAENVMMPPLIQGMDKARARAMALKVLEEVGLAERTEHRPGELSGGEQQRVAVARALVMNPSLVLADEPTGNLDSRTGGRIQDLLVEWSARNGAALVVATHDEQLAARMARQVRIRDGKVVDERG